MENKKETYVFVGQNASCGTPNPNTGRMSMYGIVYRIDGTLKQAREWADDMYLKGTNNTIAVAGGRRKMREFCLGQTMYQFDENLHEAPMVYPEDEGAVRTWVIG